MQKISFELTEEQAIINHEILNQIMLCLTLKRSKSEFELVESLPLTFEISHFEQLQEAESILRKTLENSQEKPGQSKITLSPGQIALVLPDHETLENLESAVIEADSWTGSNYQEKVLDESTIIKN